jgi:hypothetical protein
MPESPPLTYQSVRRRAPEPLEEAVEKAVADLMAFTLQAYDLPNLSVTRADVGTDLELPAVVVRAARLRESIPTGDVYEVEVSIAAMVLMDKLNDCDPNPEEYMDELWSAVVAVVEDPQFFQVLSDSRSYVRWHGLTRNNPMEVARQERHAVRTMRFSVHVSRLYVA